jgi:hypothetical protein
VSETARRAGGAGSPLQIQEVSGINVNRICPLNSRGCGVDFGNKISAEGNTS